VKGSEVRTKSESSFMSALSTAPLSICIDASSDAFGDYTSGVVTE